MIQQRKKKETWNLNEHLSMKFRFERSTQSHHRTFAAENDATLRTFTDIWYEKSLFDGIYSQASLSHNRYTATLPERLHRRECRGSNGPRSLYPTHCRLPGTDIELRDPSSTKKFCHNTH